MSGRTILIVLMCCAIGCSMPKHSEHATSLPAPDSVRLVVVTEAPAFALRPSVVDSDQIVVPLPPERSHLANVEVYLLVTRRDTGEIIDQQRDVFDWETRGAALRFFLPNLPNGDYIAQIRTLSTVLTATGGSVREVEFPDQAQVALHSDGLSKSPETQTPSRSNNISQLPRIYEFEYHFEAHRDLGDVPALIAEDASVSNLRLKTVLRNNTIVKVTLDCWASSDGDYRYNMLISQRRCAWIRENVLQSALDGRTPIQPIEVAHGEDNLPMPEQTGITDEELQDIQKKNRVVILKVYTAD